MSQQFRSLACVIEPNTLVMGSDPTQRNEKSLTEVSDFSWLHIVERGGTTIREQETHEYDFKLSVF
jgi:hypothetical protein